MGHLQLGTTGIIHHQTHIFLLLLIHKRIIKITPEFLQNLWQVSGNSQVKAMWCGAGEDSWESFRLQGDQSVLKEVNPEYPLEGLMLRLKLQYSGHLMWRADSVENTLMLGKIACKRRRGQQRMQWLDRLNGHVSESHLVMSNSLRPHELQHARPPCPSPTPEVHPNPCLLSRWCHPTISSSAVPFSSSPQSFPASGSFPVSQLFTSGGQSIGASPLALGLT